MVLLKNKEVYEFCKSFAQSDVWFSWLKTFYGRSFWGERERLQPHGRDVGSIRRVQAHTLGCDLKETAKLHYKSIWVEKDILT